MVKKVRKNAKAKGVLKKRWFATASGWGLQLSLGSGDASPGKSKRSLGTGVDTRFYVRQFNVAVANFTHNTIYTHNLMSGIAQGTTQSSRLGNEVTIDTIYSSFSIDTAGAAFPLSGISIRFLVVALTQQYSAVDLTSGVGSSDMFFGSSVLLTVARIDPRLCRVLCDDIVHVQPTVSTTTGYSGVTRAFSLGCTVKQPFEYRAATSFGTAANLYLLAIPVTSNGANGTTTVCSLSGDVVVAYTSK